MNIDLGKIHEKLDIIWRWAIMKRKTLYTILFAIIGIFILSTPLTVAGKDKYDNVRLGGGSHVGDYAILGLPVFSV